MRLQGGTGAIVSAFLKDLPAERLHLGAQLTRVAMGKSHTQAFRVRRRRRGGIRCGAGHPGASAEASRLHGRFEPALKQETLDSWRQTPTWMAPHAKFFALYYRAFWRDTGLLGTALSGVGPLVEIHDATTASGAAALFGFVGLSLAQRMAIGGALVRASVAQLARLFGDQAALPRATLLKDWAADHLTSTDADQSVEGHPVPEPRALGLRCMGAAHVACWQRNEHHGPRIPGGRTRRCRACCR